MENGIKLMIYKNRKVYVNFRDGIPYISVKESFDGETIQIPIDSNLLENVEEYRYFIEIEVFSSEYMAARTYKFFYKSESDANEAAKKYKYAVGKEFFDDEIIRKVLGPLEV